MFTFKIACGISSVASSHRGLTTLSFGPNKYASQNNIAYVDIGDTVGYELPELISSKPDHCPVTRRHILGDKWVVSVADLIPKNAVLTNSNVHLSYSV